MWGRGGGDECGGAEGEITRGGGEGEITRGGEEKEIERGCVAWVTSLFG